MSIRTKLYKGVVLLAGGQVATQSLALLRNIIIARILSPENVGIAATFVMTITFLEMISYMAVDMFLVQAKEGDAPEVQAVAQLFKLLRGFLIGIVLYISAPIIAQLFKTPDAEWAYRLIAVIPMIQGFMHLDWKRQQRHLKYNSTLLVEVVPQLLITLAAYPMVIWLNNYAAVAWLVLSQAISGVIISRIVAVRAYKILVDKKLIRRILIFSWPLLINGLLSFVSMQGDRLIIGTTYSMADLGIYSVATSLVIAIILVIAKFNTSIFLPALSSVQNSQLEFRDRYLLGVDLLAMVAGFSALPFIIFGGDIIILLFGDQYITADAFVPWFGALIAARIFRMAPTAAALAQGETLIPMLSNLYRMLGVAAAIIAAYYKMPVYWIIICGTFGELMAFIAATRLIKKISFLLIDSFKAPFVVSLVLINAVTFNNCMLTVFERIGLYLILQMILIMIMIIILPIFREFFLYELSCVKKWVINFRKNTSKIEM
jgi:O-antigen/teichoic acid export membrane protein